MQNNSQNTNPPTLVNTTSQTGSPAGKSFMLAGLEGRTQGTNKPPVSNSTAKILGGIIVGCLLTSIAGWYFLNAGQPQSSVQTASNNAVASYSQNQPAAPATVAVADEIQKVQEQAPAPTPAIILASDTDTSSQQDSSSPKSVSQLLAQTSAQSNTPAITRSDAAPSSGNKAKTTAKKSTPTAKTANKSSTSKTAPATPAEKSDVDLMTALLVHIHNTNQQEKTTPGTSSGKSRCSDQNTEACASDAAVIK